MTDLAQLPNARDFVWRDGERVVHFGQGALMQSPATLEAHGWSSFELLTTQRALESAPLALPEAAKAVHLVAPGKVADVSAELIGQVAEQRLVALGGGRVIDSAKAIAAVRDGLVTAIPTTLSGAEMTRLHRHPAGHRAPRQHRPALVLADPLLMTDLPERELRATAMNALAHGAEALFGPAANPLSSVAGLRGAELIAAALDETLEGRDRAALAVGSLLCAHAIDGAGLSLHHAVCQELVRGVGLPHAETNAAMLPHTMEAMRDRVPRAMDALAEALVTRPDHLRERLTELGGGPRRLGGMGGDATRLGDALDAIRARVEGTMDPPMSRRELQGLVESAW